MPARLADGLGLGSVRRTASRAGQCAPGARVPRVLRVAQDLGRPLFYALFVPAADLNADRRAQEAELFSYLVDEEALVREMKLGGDVGKEDKRRRRDANLRRVE